MDNLDMAVLFFVRCESLDRFINLKTSISFMYKTINAPIFLLEADASPNPQIAEFIKNIPNIQYDFIKDEQLILHRTKYINILIKKAKKFKTVALWDVDIICNPKQILWAYKLALEGITLVYPYTAYGFWNLKSRADSIKFEQSLNLDDLSSDPNTYDINYSTETFGGCYIANRENYIQCGGENEYFEGWGYEDWERETRAQKMGYGVARIPGNIYHLYHPRGINSSASNPKWEFTLQEFKKIKTQLTKDQLQKYINNFPWKDRL